MSLPIQAIAADVCVAPQLEPSAMAEAAAAGFKSVINNRPDFEGGPDQPTSAQIEAAAQAAGLQYVYLPVASTGQTPEQIEQAAQVLARLPRPVLLFCRSGARSARLYQAATQTS
ncbi:TIGR01244 family sulfur transferase [Caldimonas caldifontis]|uniref:TIGR01244 family phosphatase n=1 Tax=Caldimonas caldifontis TaxID=1452508 RepID=A0A2S5SW64_9BURK|nr:TIGR01244 family sulfur transferase [Caldimonas caldifontis]PPE67003.1 TIGR01244 family phosphatase [Caldimonas caldifontis]